MSRRIQLSLKRAFDVIVSFTVLTLLSPFMALIALAVKHDDGGPVLYVQDRVGKGGKIFRCYKFRTMVVGAENKGLGLEVAKGKTIYDPEITQHCVAIARGLKAIGPITVQCMLRDGKPYFTEINPRFGGGVPLGIAAGVRSPHWLLTLSAGRSVEVPPLGSYKVGLYLTRFDDSFFLTEEELLTAESAEGAEKNL